MSCTMRGDLHGSPTSRWVRGGIAGADRAQQPCRSSLAKEGCPEPKPWWKWV